MNHLPIVKTCVWCDEAATAQFAKKLAARPALHQAFIALHGEFGAGKTTLVRYLLRALGVSGRVKSPSYGIVELYELADFKVWHFDFYRFADPREWEEAGFRDIFSGSGLKLVEWPGNAADCLPRADLVIALTHLDESARGVTLQAYSQVGQSLLEAPT